MSQGFGHNAWIGWGQESTFGTRVAPGKFLEILKENFKREATYLSKPALRSPSMKNRVRSKLSVSGGFTFQFPWDGAEQLLKHALGSVVTTGVGPYTHTFSLESTIPTGLTFHVNRDAAAVGAGSAFEYEGCQIQKITFRQEVENFLECDIEVLGEDSRNLAVATPTFPTFDGVDWEDLSSFALDADGSGSGPLLLQVRNLEVSIENSLADERYRLGIRTRIGLGRQAQRKISGTMEVEFDSLDAYAYYLNLTQNDIQIGWVSGTKQLLFNMPAAVLNAGDPVVEGPGEILVPLAFEAWSDAADNDELEVVLINDTSSVG